MLNDKEGEFYGIPQHAFGFSRILILIYLFGVKCLTTLGRLYFIDFEYGSYSYRGYDIANHFNEYAGFDCDYSLYVAIP